MITSSIGIKLVAVGLALLTTLPFSPVASQSQPTPPEPGSPPATAGLSPDLVGHLMPPMNASGSGPVLVAGRVTNAGGPSQPAQAEILLLVGPRSNPVRTLAVPALDAQEQFEFNFTWTPPPSLSKLVLRVDTGDANVESNESNNEADTWVRRSHDRPIDRAQPFRFETMDAAPAPETRSQWEGGRFLLSVRPRGEAGVRVLVDREWLESRLGEPALENGSFDTVARDETDYHTLWAPGLTWSNFTFDAFQPTKGQSAFGRGSLDTLLLHDRPMRVGVVETPGVDEELRTVSTPNGTVSTPVNRFRDRLSLDFSDASHAGQPVWFHAAWLERFGIETPVFRHEDGKPIPAARTGDHWRIEPAHFSVIHVFDAGIWEMYEKVVSPDPANSDVTITDLSGDGKIFIRADRQDTKDETILRDFIPPTRYIVLASMNVFTQGNWQALYPFALGNRAERTNPATGDAYSAPKSMGFYYNSRDSNVPTSDPNAYPEVQAYYRTATGAKVTLWAWSAATVGLRDGWTAMLRISVGATCTEFHLISNGNWYNPAGCVSNALLPLSDVDAIFHGSEELMPNTWEPPAQVYVDAVDVNVLQGNYVNDEFNAATSWTLSGNAACCAGGYVELTSNGAYQVGRALYASGLTATRFSAEFKLYLGPNTGAGADGLTFLFYKNTAYTPNTGGGLGFIDADASTHTGHQGYGIEFDGWQNTEYGDPNDQHIALIKDHVGTHLGTPYTSFAFEGGAWHVVNVEVFEGKVFVYVDGYYKFTVPHAFTRAYTGFGFAAATGGNSNAHRIDYVRVSVPAASPPPSNQAPNTPSNPNPANEATGQPTSLTLSWSGGDPDGQTVTYTAYLDTANPPGQVAAGCGSLTTAACAVGSLQANTVYYWRVRSSDGSLTTDGPVWSFTASTNRPPDVPSNPVPAVGAVNAEWRGITLEWTSGDPDGGSVYYKVYGRPAGGSFAFVCDANRYTGSRCSWAGLARGAPYEWYVEARDEYGALTTGPTWSFTTRPNLPPTPCFFVNPSDLYVSIRSTQSYYTSECGWDPDGDATFDQWNWGDGTTTVGSWYYNPPGFDNPPWHYNTGHQYGIDQCPTGTPTITLTLTDSYGASAQSATTVTLSDWGDLDGDGLLRCREVHQGTSDDNSPDTDGDALSDYVESQWWPQRNTVFCPPAARASNCAPNPRHKDVYVEMDYMAGTELHLPRIEVLNEAVTTFQSAPGVVNLDGTGGIILHLDAGTAREDALNLGGGNELPHAMRLGNETDDSSPSEAWKQECNDMTFAQFDDRKSVHMGSERLPYFHYMIWAHHLCPGTAGLSRGVPHRDFVVALGGQREDDAHGDRGLQLRVFAHEFGHNLGLFHGGAVGESEFKPNYHSVMNYRAVFQSDGNQYAGYSTRELGLLHEGALNEFWGLNAYHSGDQALRAYLDRFQVYWDCPGGREERRIMPPPDYFVNWDCDEFRESNVAANIDGRNQTGGDVGSADQSGNAILDDCTTNLPEGCKELRGHEDWSRLVLTGLSSNPAYGQSGPYAHGDRFDETLLGPICLPALDGNESECVPPPPCGQAFGNESTYLVVDWCRGNTGLWKECDGRVGWNATDCNVIRAPLDCQIPLGNGTHYVVLNACEANLEVWQECDGQAGWAATDCRVNGVPSECQRAFGGPYYTVLGTCDNGVAVWKECNAQAGWQPTDCQVLDASACRTSMATTSYYVVLELCQGALEVWQECDGQAGRTSGDCQVVGPPAECRTGIGGPYYAVLNACTRGVEVWQECNGQPGWQPSDCSGGPGLPVNPDLPGTSPCGTYEGLQEGSVLGLRISTLYLGWVLCKGHLN